MRWPFRRKPKYTYTCPKHNYTTHYALDARNHIRWDLREEITVASIDLAGKVLEAYLRRQKAGQLRMVGVPFQAGWGIIP